VAQYVSSVIIFGKDAPALEAVLKDVCSVIRVDNLTQAVQQAAKIAQPKDIVLLAPACSSLDMFTDYQQRGTQFKEEVLKLCQ
jgi:UDP-N-acetylmuramoylalanine--D-glutamate ligase